MARVEGPPIVGSRNYTQYCQIALLSVLAVPAAGLFALRLSCWASEAFASAVELARSVEQIGTQQMVG